MRNFYNEPSEPWRNQMAEALSDHVATSLRESLRQPLTVSGMARTLDFHDRTCAFGASLTSPTVSQGHAKLCLDMFALIQHGANQMSEAISAQSETITAMAAKIDWLESENRELRERVEATDLQAQIDGLKESLYSLRAFAVNTSDFVTGAQSNRVDRLQLELDDLKQVVNSDLERPPND